MSLDLHVFGSQPVDEDRVMAVCEAAEGSRLVGDLQAAPASLTLERLVRGEYTYVASLDGPFSVEQEDLPEAVRARAVGVSVTYQLVVEGSSAPSFKLTERVARGLAEASRGVVYDPQLDDVTWPRGGTRTFKPAPTTLVDVVRCSWYVRRSDMATSIARDVLDELAAQVPEAMPRRFGSYEPLQFKLDVAGPEGFAEQWGSEPTGIFWKASRPCFGGSTFGLARELGRPPIPHPVGDIALSFDRRAFDDERWHKDLVDLFLGVVDATDAFCAVAEVDRSIGYSGGNLWYGPEAETHWGLVVRGVWQGLPDTQPWLLWLGPIYVDLLESDHAAFERQGAGLLRRRSLLPLGEPEAPPRSFLRRRRPTASRQDLYSAVPQALRMMSTGSPGRGGERRRAAVMPEGL